MADKTITYEIKLDPISVIEIMDELDHIRIAAELATEAIQELKDVWPRDSDS